MYLNHQNKMPVTLVLIVANIIVFLLTDGISIVTGGTQPAFGARMTAGGLLYGPLVADGEYWRLFTSMFLHGGLTHLANNMIALAAFGSYLEKGMGHVRFAILYLGGGLIGSVLETIWQLRGEPVPTLGASGAIFALMGGLLFAAVWKRKNIVMPPLRRVLLAVAISILPGLYEPGVSFTGHLFGLIGGFVLAPFVLTGRGKRQE